jgi:hypothetical protein
LLKLEADSIVETAPARADGGSRRALCPAQRKSAGLRIWCLQWTISTSLASAPASAHEELRISSIGEEMGVLWLVPARTMRATAAECLPPVTSHAIRKHLRDRGLLGPGVSPDFMTKRDSELVDILDEAPTTPSVPRLA